MNVPKCSAKQKMLECQPWFSCEGNRLLPEQTGFT